MKDNNTIKAAYHFDLKEKGMVLKLKLYHTALWQAGSDLVEGEIQLYDLTLDDCCKLVEGIAKYKADLLDKRGSQESAERPVGEENATAPSWLN